jgi:type IV pilus assembly protein PilY1
VAVGSGDRQHPLATHYPYTSPVTNRFYVYLDDLTVSAASGAAAIALDSDTGMRNYSTPPGCDVAGATVESGLRGWYKNLDGGRGEQVVSSAAIFNGVVTFNTHRATAPAEASCTNSLGEARGYAVNLFNAGGAIGSTAGNCGGTSSALFVGGGLVSSPFVSNVVIDGTAEAVLSGGINISGAPTSAVNLQRLSSSANLKRARRIVYWKSNLAND